MYIKLNFIFFVQFIILVKNLQRFQYFEDFLQELNIQKAYNQELAIYKYHQLNLKDLYYLHVVVAKNNISVLL